ncbi:hypothetical protein CSE16_08830 [Solibacillus sp. R5-41]|uniref:DUF2651 family protein n=1 Tax=Solibacillus sp. R5-41 TaxID=2048654 RepID=UPI000C12585A|nr:DUF2651 family protein [Solibacillus sp. R5-41]ATP40144.1 hypothetical protein CSE16_08830 [Solibacillus sp. R5-41]
MEFLIVFLILPIIVHTVSSISYMFFKKWFIAPLIVFSVLTILTFTTFGETFFFWVIIFTIFSIITSIMTTKKSERTCA